jgi:hypothetical protein
VKTLKPIKLYITEKDGTIIGSVVIQGIEGTEEKLLIEKAIEVLKVDLSEM